MKYDIIIASSFEELVSRINSLPKGWRPQGGAATLGLHLFQAVILPENEITGTTDMVLDYIESINKASEHAAESKLRFGENFGEKP